jgi:prevent-host-death family protein
MPKKTLTVTATEAKNQFGPLLESAMQGQAIVITRHDVPKAVLLSVKEYEALVAANRPVDIGALRGEFDKLLTEMQSPESIAAVEALFEASPAELRRHAVEYAKRRS